MERGSDKHSPRLDDVIKHDPTSLESGPHVDSITGEGREPEVPGPDEHDSTSRFSGGHDPAAGTDVLTHDEVEARSELARHLQRSVFPADREALIASARELDAPPSLIQQLAGLPDGTFEHLEAVWEALGGRVEYRG